MDENEGGSQWWCSLLVFTTALCGSGSWKRWCLLREREVVRRGAARSRHTPMVDGAVKMMKTMQVRGFTGEKEDGARCGDDGRAL